MTHTFDTKNRTVSNTNPALCPITPTAGATVLVLSIVSKVERFGGTPTFNGATMIQAGVTKIAVETICNMWYLLNPSIGTYNISIPNTYSDKMYLIASVYKSSTGESAFDVTAGTNAISANPSLAVTPTEDGDVIVDVMGDGYNSIPSANNKTLLYSIDNDFFSDNHQYELQNTATLTTFTWTVASDDWCMILTAFKEVSTGPTGHPWFYRRYQ